MATKAGDKIVPAPMGGKPSKSTGVGKTNADMKKMGRNLAKIAAQKRG